MNFFTKLAVVCFILFLCSMLSMAISALVINKSTDEDTKARARASRDVNLNIAIYSIIAALLFGVVGALTKRK